MRAAAERKRTTKKVVKPGLDSGPDYLSVCETARQQLSPMLLKASSYAEVYWVIYDSETVPRRVVFSPRETSPTLGLSLAERC